MFSKVKTNKGFTLIELLVVIAIISLLASAILASISSVRDKAKTARIAAQLKSLDTTFNLIYDKYGCWPTDAGAGGSCSGGGNTFDVSTLYSGNSWSIRDYVSGNIAFGNFEATPGNPYRYRYENTIEAADCSSDDLFSEGVSIMIPSTPDVYEKLEKIFDGTNSNFYARSARSCGKIQTDALSAASSSILINYKLGPANP